MVDFFKHIKKNKENEMAKKEKVEQLQTLLGSNKKEAQPAQPSPGGSQSAPVAQPEPQAQPAQQAPATQPSPGGSQSTTAMTAPAPAQPAPVGRLEGAFSEYSPEEMEALGNSTGLEGMPEEGRRPALYSWNLDFVDERQVDVKPDRFYNGLNSETYEKVNCALIFVRKTREFSMYDESTRQKTNYCRSWDMKVGTVQDLGDANNPFFASNERERSCDRCPHCQSSKKGEKKRCTYVLRFLAWDLDRQNFFIFNCQRSSFVPMNSYLEGTFFGQWKVGSKRRDLPLYLIHTVLTLVGESGRGKRYYRLQPMVGTDRYKNGVLPKKIVMDLQTTAEASRNMARASLEADQKNAKYHMEQDQMPTDDNPPVESYGDDNDSVPF